jgi:cytochrome P450
MSETTAPGQVFQFDTLLNPEFSREPQPWYRLMRNTNPVLRTQSLFGSDRPTVYLSRHEDIDFALHHPEVFSNEYPGSRLPDQWLVPQQMDPPEHKKYRKILDPLFSVRNMNGLAADIEQRINDLIDAFIGRGECDVVEEFAIPLPASVFMRLMGLPLEQADTWLDIKERMIRGDAHGARSDMSQTTPNLRTAHREFAERFEELIESRRRDPQDDVLTAVVNAELDGEPIPHAELLGVCRLLFVAGLDTVTDSLTCFFAFLAQHPEHRRRLVEDPDSIPMAVEEMLRYETPAPWVPRVAAQDFEINGTVINAGDEVVLLVGSADTDERAYERVDEVDFDRPHVKHFAFGAGVHKCLGMHLARLELRTAMRVWHERIPEYHIPEGVELQWAPVMRQVMELPLVFDKGVG